jgi:hypothetical protein
MAAKCKNKPYPYGFPSLQKRQSAPRRRLNLAPLPASATGTRRLEQGLCDNLNGLVFCRGPGTPIGRQPPADAQFFSLWYNSPALRRGRVAGLARTLGKRVTLKVRGFESRPLRQKGLTEAGAREVLFFFLLVVFPQPAVVPFDIYLMIYSGNDEPFQTSPGPDHPIVHPCQRDLFHRDPAHIRPGTRSARFG